MTKIHLKDSVLSFHGVRTCFHSPKILKISHKFEHQFLSPLLQSHQFSWCGPPFASSELQKGSGCLIIQYRHSASSEAHPHAVTNTFLEKPLFCMRCQMTLLYSTHLPLSYRFISRVILKMHQRKTSFIYSLNMLFFMKNKEWP